MTIDIGTGLTDENRTFYWFSKTKQKSLQMLEYQLGISEYIQFRVDFSINTTNKDINIYSKH